MTRVPLAVAELGTSTQRPDWTPTIDPAPPAGGLLVAGPEVGTEPEVGAALVGIAGAALRALRTAV
ncbi:hypothetical protein GCM10009682_51560 [Luedemannella flava]|uniref:Uncharacterized protein n=1 Tax=Luedemannella flava TaxID=349316 RepID=A0ABP4YVI3_9ACTN